MTRHLSTPVRHGLQAMALHQAVMAAAILSGNDEAQMITLLCLDAPLLLLWAALGGSPTSSGNATFLAVTTLGALFWGAVASGAARKKQRDRARR